MGYGNWLFGANRIDIISDAVQGISWATAYNLQDVALAIAFHAWVADWTEQCESTHFCSGVRLRIGANTYFWDMNKLVTFKSTALTGANQVCLHVLNTAHLRFGNLVNLANKVTERGCALISNVDQGNNRFIYCVNGGEVQFYSSFFKAHERVHWTQHTGATADNFRVWNSLFPEGIQFGPLGQYDIHRVTIQSPIGVVPFYNLQGGNFNDLHVGNRFSVIHAIGANAITMSNVYARNNTYACVGQTTTADSYLINWDSDTWVMDWIVGASTGLFVRQYQFDCTVVDRVTGAGIVGAIVNLYDQTGALVFSVPTGAGGVIATQIVTYATYTDAGGAYPHQNTTVTAYYPFTMVVTYPTYHEYIKPSITFGVGTRRLYENVALCRAPDIVFVDDRLALNLDAENPESELFTQI